MESTEIAAKHGPRQVKLVSLENRYDKLSDDLWGEETGAWGNIQRDRSRRCEESEGM